MPRSVPLRSHLSQSEPALTFGLGKRDKAGRAVLTWPSGRIWECTEARASGIRGDSGAHLCAVGPLEC
ncbi:MAG: ASPIC/UnbV domain-containing protein [Bryobacteraceae bacterium]